MQKNDEDRPVLNAHESDAYVHATMLRDNGATQADAARAALAAMEGRITAPFVEWLSGGALTLTKGEVVSTDGEAAETVST
jgi:hypothetical protein